jgi:hypothetical protein
MSGPCITSQLQASAAQQAHAADRLIECSIVAYLICVSYQFLFGTLFHPAAADARSVRPHLLLSNLRS